MKKTYIISEIEDRIFGNRSIPALKTLKDLDRLSQFITTRKGLEFLAKQNVLGLSSNVVFT